MFDIELYKMDEKGRQGWKLVEKVDQKYPYVQGKEEETSFADYYIFRRK